MACRKPSPRFPSNWSLCTRQFSITTSAVSLARIPSLFSLRPGRKPCIPFSRTKAEIPRLPRSGSVRANTTATSAETPWVAKVFEPLRMK